ncbi:MAG: EAL domain-containing protein [Rhodocyclaceae bacterium]|nr:EAL domain-containing protein [Rhodocyclaceae bacterium]
MTAPGSIRLWLLRHLAWLSLVPALLVSVALGTILVATIEEDLESENRAFGDGVVAEVEQLLTDPMSELIELAGHLEPLSAIGDAQRILDTAVLANRSFEHLYLTDADDRVIAGAQATGRQAVLPLEEIRGLDLSGREHVRQARSAALPVWSDSHLSTLAGQIAVAIAVPAGEGILVGEINLNRLSEFSRRLGATGHLIVVVLDRRGQVVAHPDPSVALQQVNLGHLPMVGRAHQGAREQHEFELGGNRYVGVAGEIAGPRWIVIVGQPIDHSRGQIERAIGVTLLALIGIAILSSVLASRLSRRLGAPLDALVQHAVEVSAGRYDAPPPPMSWPEIDRLRDAMDRMVRSIVLRERALLSTEHRYRSLVDGLEDLIVQVDLDLVILFCNPAAETLLGRPAGDCLGQPLLDLVSREDREEIGGAIERWLNSEQWQLSVECRTRPVTGQPLRLLWSLTKEFDDAGHLTGLRGIARDITAVRRSQEALRGLVAATARQSGEAFFRSLVSHLARTLDVAHVLVSERAETAGSMRTLAVWSGKSFSDNFTYETAGTPCERLLRSDRGVLAEAIESPCCPTHLCESGQLTNFLGAALRDTHGNGVGTLVVLSDRDLSLQPENAQLISIFADRAAMELARQQLESELRLAASVFANSAEGIMITDAEHRIISANAACEPITGYAPAELIGETPRLLRSGRHGTEFYEALARELAAEGQWTGEVWNRRKDGRVYPQWMTVTAVRGPDGRPHNYIASFFDISARKEAEARIHFLAHHDALTGLPNRILLQDRLGQALSIAARDDRQVAVMFLDLDRFKLVNDSLGHDVGDALLEEVARRLSAVLRQGETVARLGGDEFVIVLPGLHGTEAAALVATRALEALGEPLSVRNQSFHVTASVGISLYPRDGESVETLLRNADTAMYHAKELGRANFQFYTEGLNAIVTERVRMETDLRGGLERGEFVVHYQPQVDARSGRIVGAEALVRWMHPGQGMISPARFIPVAEDTGLIVPLGAFVLREACRQAARWHRQFDEPMRMGVNLSARQFSSGEDLIQLVRDALADSGLPPDQLELEITESMLMERPDEATALLGRLSELGVRLAIDDFGTGYSSLSYLKRFAIDRLKVDQSFIQDLSDDPNDAAIVEAVISLARSLKLEVIAEGVETREHLDQLRAWGCFDVQGFLFSKPLPAAEFEVFRQQFGNAG